MWSETVTRLIGVVIPATLTSELSVPRSGIACTVLLLKATAVPGEPVGKLKCTWNVPFVAVATVSVKSIFVPHRKSDVVENWNGVLLLRVVAAGISGYREYGCVITTPGVSVESNPDTPLASTPAN